MLLVFLIIAVLCAILFTGIGAIRAMMNKTKCVFNLRQIGVACLQYAADNNGKLPYREGVGMHWTPLHFVAALVGNSGSAGYLPWEGNPSYPLWSDVFMCPGDPNREVYRKSNGISSVPDSYIYRQNEEAGEITPAVPTLRPIRTTTRPESQMGYRRWIVRDRSMYGYAEKKPYPGEFKQLSEPSSWWGPDRQTSRGYWHNNGVNVLAEDGSVQWRPWGETVSY